MENFKTTTFDCTCTTPEHSLRIIFCPDDKAVYIDTQLCKLGFFSRLLAGIKYILGVKSKYGSDGHWEETVLNETDFCNLFKMMHEYNDAISSKPSKKIQKALSNISEGTPNSAVDGLHSEKSRDILAKNKK